VNSGKAIIYRDVTAKISRQKWEMKKQIILFCFQLSPRI